jgi:predicted Rossmann fold nucleotide-binding protein DprA/Smf involved in DNA uptake
MRLAVVGSRSWVDAAAITRAVSSFSEATEIVSGGADGADTIAATVARNLGLGLVEIRPDYLRHGKGAPLVRNREIVDLADVVLAFWDGKSRGTMHAVNYARKKGKVVHVFTTDIPPK